MTITQLDPTGPVSAAVQAAGPAAASAPSVRRVGEVVETVKLARTAVSKVGDLVASTDPGCLDELLVELTKLGSQVASARMRVLARAQETRLPERSGFTDVGSWAARSTRQDRPTVAREAKLAEALGTDAGETGAALAAGAVGTAHCQVIADALRSLPQQLDTEQRHAVERSLVARAATLTPTQLRRAARRALDAVESDPAVVDAHHDALLRDQESLALAKTRFTCHDNDDGTTTGHFTVPTFSAHALTKLLHAMSSPRRQRIGASADQGDGIRRDDPDRFAKRAGLAFAELIEHLPTEHLAKPNVTVVVTMTLQGLRDGLRAAGVDDAEEISAGEARRLACGAGLVPAVLGGASKTLDLGRSQRLFGESQRQALGIRHTTCSAQGCERPFAWCELHHDRPWSRGGPTDLDNARPLCWFHHRRIHDPAYEHQRAPDGTITFARIRC